MVLGVLASISRSPFFPSPNTFEIPWYTSFNVVSSAFPEEDMRYVPPFKAMDPRQTTQKLCKHMDATVVRRPSLFLPTDAHYVIRHGKHGFYDDVWLSFTKNETHVVSASRVGIFDMGVNRNRVQKLRDIL